MSTRRPAKKPAGLPGPTFEVERELLSAGAVIAGLDEVGRGAWAGPVTVGAVVLDPDQIPAGLRDSKQLAPVPRAALAEQLHARAVIAVGEVPVRELDRIGLAAALRLAARRALAALAVRPDTVLIDGPVDLLHGEGLSTRCIVGGDDRVASIAAASIVAKVHRDAGMVALHDTYPRYGFASHKGYATPAHRAALGTYGPCEVHRHSWQPIRALLADQLELPGTA
ncbi:MAG: ribonuclease HII [Nitriliruptoraceae bacterium]